jgi:hypothetical protein
MMVDGFHRSQADAVTRRSTAIFPQVGHTCEYLDALFSKQNNTEVGHTHEDIDQFFMAHHYASAHTGRIPNATDVGHTHNGPHGLNTEDSMPSLVGDSSDDDIDHDDPDAQQEPV